MRILRNANPNLEGGLASPARRLLGQRVRYQQIIADNLSKAGWSWGCVSGVDSRGRTIFVADAHCGDGQRFIVRADEKPSAFIELESAIRDCAMT